MASNLACVGLGVQDADGLDRLLREVLPSATAIGHVAGMDITRWQDPSGARLVFGVREGKVVAFLPSFAAAPTTRLAGIVRANDTVATAAVVDADGEQLTALAMELEQIELLPEEPVDTAMAGITFLGNRVTVHADADAFAASPASLLQPDADPDEPPPPHYAERDWPWPPRVGSESFFSYGVFGDPAASEAVCRFAGVVRHAERRTVHQTGQSFVVATLRTCGIEAAVCLSGADFAAVPVAGNVLAGECFIVGSLPSLEVQPEAAAPRSWWRRRK